MKGDILQQHGSYLEIILEESGSTRLVLCGDFKPEDPNRSRFGITEWSTGTRGNYSAKS